MAEPILSREAIAKDADIAAQRAVFTSVPQPNPHVIGTEAYAVWKCDYERQLLRHSAPEGAEGGA